MALRAALLLALVAMTSAQKLRTMVWKEIPSNTLAETSARSSSQVTIDGVVYNVSWTPTLESGKTYPGFDGSTWAAGTVLDKFGNIITASNSSDADPALARDFDFTSVFMKFGKVWQITHNEDSYGSFFLMQLNQDPVTGTLSISKGRTINTNAVYGAVRPCSGSLTPWTTHLAGLETTSNARTYPTSTSNSAHVVQARVQGLASWRDVSPYWYGFFIEVDVTSVAGDTKVTKHYAAGRAGWESAVFAPDQRTALCTEDNGSGGIVTLFVADKPKDMSSGKIFCHKLTQLNAADGGSFAVEWISMNNNQSTNNSYAQSLLGPNNTVSIKFADIFDYVAPVFINATLGLVNLTAKPDGFREVKVGGTNYEWLKLKDGMQAAASIFETARLASYLGCTTEWTKVEGQQFDWRTRDWYFASTNMANSMLDNPGSVSSPTYYDLGGTNQIRLPLNLGGAVYKARSANVPGVSAYTPVSIQAVITSFGYNSVASVANSVPQNSIASPDNVGTMSRYRMITIAEDCDYQHISNYGWVYNLDTRELTRIISSPFDAEITGFYYFPNVGNFSYLTATVQHPRTSDMPCTVGMWTLPKE